MKVLSFNREVNMGAKRSAQITPAIIPDTAKIRANIKYRGRRLWKKFRILTVSTVK